MTKSLPHEHLLAILETQNEIAASSLGLEAVMALVVRRGRVLTGGDAAMLELQEGDEMVYRAANGSAEGFLGYASRWRAAWPPTALARGRSSTATTPTTTTGSTQRRAS